MTGVVAVNAVLLAVGYCVLGPALRGLKAVAWLSWAGVALLAGAALVVLGLLLAATLGAATGPRTFAAVAVLLAGGGLAACFFAPQGRFAPPVPPARPSSGVLAEGVATIAAAAVGMIALALVVGGFRASPWLDDAWGIWLPKGIALSHLGLDERLFTANGGYVHFEVPDYPLWWSTLAGLDARFAAEVDVRVLNAQLAILVVGFLAAAARLLWGWVRPWLLWTSLLILAASPALLHHSQSGMADLPLAVFLALALLAGAGWVSAGGSFYLGLVVVFGSAAAAIKAEGLVEVLLMLAVLGLFAPGRRAALWLAAVAVAATTLPWFAWRTAHGVAPRVSVGDSLDPLVLATHVNRLGPGAEGLLRHLLDPSEWLLLVPLALGLSLAGFTRERHTSWLALPALLATGFALLMWAYWVDRDDIHYLVATSAYRVVDPLLLIAALAIPLLAERMLQGPAARTSRDPRLSPRERTER